MVRSICVSTSERSENLNVCASVGVYVYVCGDTIKMAALIGRQSRRCRIRCQNDDGEEVRLDRARSAGSGCLWSDECVRCL